MKNILLIDDDTAFAGLIKMAFDSSQFTVIHAENGVEGLKRMESFKPDVILLDVMMPEMNGIDFLKQMKQKYSVQKIPVIMISNVSSFEKIAESVELGIRSYIVKSNESIQGIVTAVKGILK